jgi:hypothetical protein
MILTLRRKEYKLTDACSVWPPVIGLALTATDLIRR